VVWRGTKVRKPPPIVLRRGGMAVLLWGCTEPVGPPAPGIRSVKAEGEWEVCGRATGAVAEGPPVYVGLSFRPPSQCCALLLPAPWKAGPEVWGRERAGCMAAGAAGDGCVTGWPESVVCDAVCELDWPAGVGCVAWRAWLEGEGGVGGGGISVLLGPFASSGSPELLASKGPGLLSVPSGSVPAL